MEPRLFDACRQHPDFRPLSELPHVHLDLRYAGTDNICGRDLYAGEREAWLHVEAYNALAAAGRALQARRPGWKLRIYDAARPLSVQAELFARVQGTPEQAYVADPAQGSVHNYGMALDCGLQDAQGWEADHGTPFDSFQDLAQPQLEEAFFHQGRLSPEQLGLRRLLRELLCDHGFNAHPLEWWHFDRRPLSQLRGRYPLIQGQALAQGVRYAA
jgi:D-alanyl-D-alanine dipeptidase